MVNTPKERKVYFMNLQSEKPVFYINEKKEDASKELAYLLREHIISISRPWSQLVFLCIGSDRITGDSLGPLIGHELLKYALNNVIIYGSLANPVHALNLADTMELIKERHPSSLVIAIDASLGSKQHLGFITIGHGSISPGAGVHKTLPPVGDIFVTGIVNTTGTFEHFLLQTTRLSTIVALAESISKGIRIACDSTLENGVCLVQSNNQEIRKIRKTCL